MEEPFPFRLIITSRCNGKCGFCHNEGNQTQIDMPLQLIADSISASQSLGLKTISISGGEPCLHPSFSNILRLIEHGKINGVSFSITSNGLTLIKYRKEIDLLFYSISCSVFSLDKKIWSKYTGINPNQVINILHHIKIDKEINILVNEDNYQEIGALISVCEQNLINMKFMVKVPLDEQSELMQKYILKYFYSHYQNINLLKKDNRYYLSLSSGKIQIRINIPLISKLQNLARCESCVYYEKCGEYVCATRLYPNGKISNCLNNHVFITDYKSLLLGINELSNLMNRWES